MPEQEEIEPIKFGKWLADNVELGIHSESKHYFHSENRIIEITIEDAYKVFTCKLTKEEVYKKDEDGNGSK